MLPKNDWARYSNLGFQIMATLAIFGWFGYWLDSRFPDLQPLFLIISLLFGVVVALYHLWVSVFK
tara:strand:+ start:662 stop:856 length:195 start_codon:yes stop_codon:yes gene_type:complete